MKRTYLAITLLIVTAIIFSVYLYTQNTRFWFKQGSRVIGDRITGGISYFDKGQLVSRAGPVSQIVKEVAELAGLVLLIFLNIWAWRKAFKEI